MLVRLRELQLVLNDVTKLINIFHTVAIWVHKDKQSSCKMGKAAV